jgi:hypothetical protein
MLRGIAKRAIARVSVHRGRSRDAAGVANSNQLSERKKMPK